MFIKLLVGPAASGKSTYTRAHKSEDDIVSYTIGDQLIIEDQTIAYRLQRELGLYFALMDNVDIEKLAKDRVNGERFVKLCSAYFGQRGKELTLWIESKNISQEAIDVLADSYKHRFELIEFPQK